jgi:PRTRC genetic system ThiF family protein
MSRQQTPFIELEQVSASAPIKAPTKKKPSVPAPAAGIDLSYAYALPLVTYDYRQINVVIVGLGGTGSWLAPQAVRVVKTLLERGKKARLIFIDHDVVETANVQRQNFCQAEVGYHKARVLAARYGLAWGLDITVYTERFSVETPRLADLNEWGSLTVYVGCVDNAKARNYLSLTVQRNPTMKELPKTFWLDCGNTKDAGQVLLGSAAYPDPLAYAFDLPGVCINLPSPVLQDPSLLVERPEELAGAEGGSSSLSCEEMALANAQSLMINQRVAAEAADYLLRLLVTSGLRKFQTFIDLPSGTSKSTYITQENIEKVFQAGELAEVRLRKQKS